MSAIEIHTVRLVAGYNATLAPIGPPAAAPVSLGPSTPSFATLHLAVGTTGPYIDASAIRWDADKYFIGGEIVSQRDQELLLTGPMGAVFSYNIPVPPGNYVIRMDFAELDVQVQPGERRFSIEAEGMLIFENVDIL